MVDASLQDITQSNRRSLGYTISPKESIVQLYSRMCCLTRAGAQREGTVCMKTIIAGILGFACLSSITIAAAPTVDPAITLQSDGSTISVTTGHSTPEIVDWNNDGLNDLVVGQYSSGKIRLYLNTGTYDAPAFSGFSYIQSSGSDIALSAG